MEIVIGQNGNAILVQGSSVAAAYWEILGEEVVLRGPDGKAVDRRELGPLSRFVLPRLDEIEVVAVDQHGPADHRTLPRRKA